MNLLVVAAILLLTTACKKETATESDKVIDTISVKQPEAGIATDGAPTTSVPADGKYPEMTFQEEEHDFGTIKQGDKPSCEFEFKNTGEADLIITSARGSCGCTVPDYPKTPIKAGESGKIKVSFDSKGKSGETSKTVTILSNTKEGSKILKIKTKIEVPQKN
nr:DUF1573 domain-containing protein [uncultured Flavobacterium sp.]